MPDFKMNENEIRSYIRESERILKIEHTYRQEIEYESEQLLNRERIFPVAEFNRFGQNSGPRLPRNSVRRTM